MTEGSGGIPTQQIKVWLDEGGTTAECSCGWHVSMPAGVLPGIVMASAESHENNTGHHWPTGEDER